MEKIIKSKNTQRSTLFIDDVEYAQTKAQKWWKSNLLLIKGDEEFAVLTKDSFWKWNFSLMKGAEKLFTIRSKWNGEILQETENGEVWKVKKKREVPTTEFHSYNPMVRKCWSWKNKGNGGSLVRTK